MTVWTQEQLDAFSSSINWTPDRQRCGETKVHIPHWNDNLWCDGKYYVKSR
jgi:hypothetical protein